MTDLEYEQKLSLHMRKYARKDKDRSGISDGDIPKPREIGTEILKNLGYVLERSNHSIMIWWNRPDDSKRGIEIGK